MARAPAVAGADPPAVISGRLRRIRAGRARGGAGPDSVINCIAVSRPNCVVVRKKRVGVVSRPELLLDGVRRARALRTCSFLTRIANFVFFVNFAFLLLQRVERFRSFELHLLLQPFIARTDRAHGRYAPRASPE